MADALAQFALLAPSVEATAVVEQDHGGEHHVGPAAFGLGPTVWVALAMAVLLVIVFGKAKLHRTIAGGLDGKIAAIRQQLDEAKALRAESEALRDEYAAKIANAEKDAAAMVEHARTEAQNILAKAESDSAAMVRRRQKMAEDKIGAAERAAVEEVQAVAAKAAASASRKLIQERHSADADRKLADQVIAGL